VQEGSTTVCRWIQSKLSQKANKKERGQGLVEFALVIPVLLLLMMGIFEFGYFFFVYSSVNTASREAVRYGAGSGANPSGVVYSMDCAGIREVARRIGQYANITDGDVAIFYDTGPGTTSKGNCNGVYQPVLGERVVVKVDVKYYPIILDWLFPVDGVPIHSESARTIIRRMQVGG
ncbi:MAG: TadE/TadG family type IV pilus assembly protein, partial [Anaerolineaceae bacterium]